MVLNVVQIYLNIQEHQAISQFIKSTKTLIVKFIQYDGIRLASTETAWAVSCY